MSDTLSDVLRAVRLTGAVFFAVDAGAPWAAETPAAREIAGLIIPGAEHVIDYHIVKSGSCWGGIVGEPPVHLDAGDVIVFPHGDAHVMSSAPGMRGMPNPGLYRRTGVQLPVRIRPEGGDRVQGAELVCGFLGCDVRPFNPVLSTLPRMIHMRHRPDDGVIVQLVNLALAESNAPRAGGECVLARLSELLFVEVVRRHLATLPAEHQGWLAGLRDEVVGRAIGKLHDHPSEAWTLESLAHEIGSSRSHLAERFAHFVGAPPMQYLARWRMQLAASMLAGTAAGLAEVAEHVGYGSEAAFSRAFKRLVGVAPALWRQGKRGDGSATA